MSKANLDQQQRNTSTLALRLSMFSERHPRIYLSAAVALMSLGYLCLFLFPFLVVQGIGALISELPNVKTMEHWLVVEVWFAILLFCLFISYQISQLHFPRVQGLKLSKELTPDLYAQIAEMRKYTERPSIRNIILTDQYELRIEETPRFGYPLWSSNTLVVGMPMLQMLSVEQFRGELMRRFGQYASGRFRVTHWLFRTQLLWNKYAHATNKSKRIGVIPLKWFFSIYAPLFESFTKPAMRQEELVADAVVLEWLNDRDYFDTVKSSSIAGLFLETHYWRNVYQSALKFPNAKLTPFAKLEEMSNFLGSKDLRLKWLATAFSTEQDYSKAIPSLRLRMDNIGQSQLRDVPLIEETAAVACLGDGRKNFVPLIDKLWYSTTFTTWKQAYEKRQTDIKKIKKLSRKSQQKVLGVRDVLAYARIARQLRGDSRLKSLRKVMTRNCRNFWPVAFFRKTFQRKLKAVQQANDIL